MEELTVKTESIVRMVEIKKTKGGHASFNVTADMNDQKQKNGVNSRDELYGNLYHPSITEEIYVIVTTEKPEGWTDPSVEKKKKKK